MSVSENLSSTTALERLSKCENFQTWEFGRIEKALAARRDAERVMARELAGDRRADDLAEGPWMGEPDKVQWIDPDTGYDCLIVRNHLGALCGYVGLPPGHPDYAKDYDAVDVSVHGGLTFAGYCDPSESDETICHRPAEGRPEKVFWLGFDCGHFMDLQPGLFGIGGLGNETYKDIGYVANEVEILAGQLKLAEYA